MKSIADEIRDGTKPQGYELTPSDKGRWLSPGFGHVVADDVGKRVWLRTFGLTMENDAQRDRRVARGDAAKP